METEFRLQAIEQERRQEFRRLSLAKAARRAARAVGAVEPRRVMRANPSTEVSAAGTTVNAA